MKYVSKRIGYWLFKNNAISYSDIGLYEYAILSILYEISPLVIFMIICIAIKRFLVGILIITPFISIRKYTGGYHASTYILCFIFSILTLLLLIFISKHPIPIIILKILVIISFIILAVCSPVEHDNHPISSKEYYIYKKKMILFCSIGIFVCFFLNVFVNKEYFTACSSSIILSGISVIPCIKKKQ